MECIRLFLDILTNALMLATVFIAYKGIAIWRDEHIGKKHVDIAEETLCLFYQVRDAFTSIRSPFSYQKPDEKSSRVPDEDETELETKALDRLYFLQERYEEHSDIFNNLNKLRYRFMVLFGEDAAKPFEDIRKTWNDIVFAAQDLFEIWAERTDPEKDEVKKLRRIIRGFGGPDDEITQRVETIIKDMEAICQPIIERSTQK